MHNANHPIWATIRFCALCIAATFVLWKNATNFDETELKAIIEIAVLAGGYEGVSSMLNRRRMNQEKTNEIPYP